MHAAAPGVQCAPGVERGMAAPPTPSAPPRTHVSRWPSAARLEHGAALEGYKHQDRSDDHELDQGEAVLLALRHLDQPPRHAEHCGSPPELVDRARADRDPSCPHTLPLYYVEDGRSRQLLHPFLEEIAPIPCNCLV